MPKVTQIGRELQILIAHHYGTAPDAETCSKLTRLAQNLHTQAENTCSYEWADTNTYRRRCELTAARVPMLASELAPLGLTLTYQGDPRGLALSVGRVGDPTTGWPVAHVGQVGLL